MSLCCRCGVNRQGSEDGKRVKLQISMFFWCLYAVPWCLVPRIFQSRADSASSFARSSSPQSIPPLSCLHSRYDEMHGERTLLISLHKSVSWGLFTRILVLFTFASLFVHAVALTSWFGALLPSRDHIRTRPGQESTHVEIKIRWLGRYLFSITVPPIIY